GDDVGVVGRRVEGAVGTQVASRDHDRNTFQPRILDGRVQGAGGVALCDRGDQREVDHPDVIGVFVDDGPQDGIHDVGRASRPSAVIDAQVEERHFGGNPDVLTTAGAAVAADDAVHGRAVAVPIYRAGRGGREVQVHRDRAGKV